MDLVNRVLYEAQQEYFMFVNSRAMGQDPSVPTFTDIKNKVHLFDIRMTKDGCCQGGVMLIL